MSRGAASTEFSESDEAEIQRLLSLNPFERDRQLAVAATALGVNLTALRKVIESRTRRGSPEPNCQGAPVQLPEPTPWPDPVDGAVLLREVVGLLGRYLVVPKYGLETIALWVVHSYVVPLGDWTPKLALISPERRCGKSTVFKCLALLVWRPLRCSGVTPAALFRVISESKPTLLMDEADTYTRGNEDLRGLLNASSGKGEGFIRCVGEDHVPRVFDVFTAIAYAMIREPAATVLDRSIVIRMKRKTKEDVVDRFSLRRVRGEFEPVASRIARFAADVAESLSTQEAVMPRQLNDRAVDNWEPLFALAAAAGGEWPQIAHRAALRLSAGVEDRTEASGERLLADIQDVFDRLGVDRITSQELCEELAKIQDGPWSEYSRHGKALTQTQLSGMLRLYEISSKTIRIANATPKGYAREWFEDSFRRYVNENGGATPQHTDGADDGGPEGTTADVAA